MANLCFNEMRVKGKLEELKRFDKQFKKEHRKFYGGTMGARSEESFIKNNDMDKIVAYKLIEPEQESSVNHVNFIREVKVVEDEYSFTNFAEMTQDDFLNGWYGWSLENWGAKWDLSQVHTDLFLAGEDDPSSIYIFDTANCPATPAVKEMSRQFTELEFEFSYHEPGMQFAGVFLFIGGDEISSQEVIGSDDNYELFIDKIFETGLLRCLDCGEFTNDWSGEKETGRCIYCDSSNIEVFMLE